MNHHQEGVASSSESVGQMHSSVHSSLHGSMSSMNNMLSGEDLRAVLAHRKNGPKVYFEQVEIHPLRITISFVMDGTVSGHHHHGHHQGSNAPLNSILRAMGARLTMIVNAPLQLNGVALSDAYVTVSSRMQ